MGEPGTDLAYESRLLRLTAEALELPEPERRAFVESKTHDRPELAQEVLALLEGEATLGEFFETSPVRSSSGSLLGEAILGAEGLPSLEGFQVVGKLGEGGMGSVFLAVQTEPVERLVALKLMRRGLRSSGARARFHAERQALARLSHRNVAQLYESGKTRDGKPFFAMELVDGSPITTYCDENRLGIRARLELFIAVCRGIQHAHQKQLVHRDIKPSNVLVTESDGEAVPKVIDFGIARSLDTPLTNEAMLTGRWVPGAPAYTCPEALAGPGSSGELDTRSDVYSLGALLYDLLVGRLPFDDSAETPLEMIRRIREEEAPRPSSRFATVTAEEAGLLAERRGTTLLSLARILRSDLDWIVLRAMARERGRRYESVAAVARDVERYLADEPIEARPPAKSYRLRKALRRQYATRPGPRPRRRAPCGGASATCRLRGGVGSAKSRRGRERQRVRNSALRGSGSGTRGSAACVGARAPAAGRGPTAGGGAA